MHTISTLLRKWKRPFGGREQLEAKAAHATVYVARDSRGRVIDAR